MIYNFLQAQGGGEMDYTFLIFMGGLFLVMYFFFMRPQMKKQKEEKKFQENLTKGQRVITTSGIHGKINEVTDNSIILETGAGKITFEKMAISREFTVARFPEYTDKKK